MENVSYLPNLCLLFGIACVTVMELERDLASRNAPGHLRWPGRQGGPSRETNGEESKELDRLCLTAHVTRCLGGAVCYSFLPNFSFFVLVIFILSAWWFSASLAFLHCSGGWFRGGFGFSTGLCGRGGPPAE